MTELEASSGLGISTPIARDRLYEEAARLVPATLSIAPPDSAEPRLPEGQVTLGGPPGGAVHGDEFADAWSLVAGRGEAPLHQGARELLAWRRSRAAVLAGDAGLLDWWQSRAPRPAAVCVVGTAIPWADVEALQGRGVWVGRLPFGTDSELRTWVEGAVERSCEPTPMPRRALVVAPRDDEFTRQVAGGALARLDALLRARRFERVDSTTTERVGLVVFMTHGSEAPDAGWPTTRDDAAARALEAIGPGAVVVHLGCHGAGVSAGSRYGDLPVIVGARPLAATAADSCSRFAVQCLARGAAAVLAHVDGTWSRTLHDCEAFFHCLDWIVSGKGSVGRAIACLAEDANRRGREAYELLAAKRTARAGESWLRSLDLRGFVCLGDPSAAVTWAAP
jgi:hypothetical protein